MPIVMAVSLKNASLILVVIIANILIKYVQLYSIRKKQLKT